MAKWPKHPFLYEVHTWQWLAELSQRHGERIDLGNVPACEWDRLLSLGFDGVWLMGVFERSPQSRLIARSHSGLQQEFHAALPDLTPDDVVGSPYAIRSYQVDAAVGGERGLAEARKQLDARGMALMLDFVPNHTAVDNAWLSVEPECYVRGDLSLIRFRSEEWFKVGNHVFAHGKDPYFPSWTDTAQLNAFSDAWRAKAVATLKSLAQKCDGVRCDMAMLLLNDIFARTWEERAGRRPPTEFWSETIGQVRRNYPEFLFVAEAYWNTEAELFANGFDYCYDKVLYDKMAHGDASAIRAHIQGLGGVPGGRVRFVENHDEPRAAATFGTARQKMATIAALTLPGMRLVHHGQLEGRRVRMPVQLGRCNPEVGSAALLAFHESLLRCLGGSLLRNGHCTLLNTQGWPDNPSHANLLTWAWHDATSRLIAVVNYSDWTSQARIPLPWTDWPLHGHIRLTDLLTGEVYDRTAEELVSPGLYVVLSAWQAHLLKVEWNQ